MCSSMPALKRDPLKTLENHKPDLGAMLSTSKKQPLENPRFNLSCQKCKIKKHRRSIKKLFYRGVNPPDFLEELECGIQNTSTHGKVPFSTTKYSATK